MIETPARLALDGMGIVAFGPFRLDRARRLLMKDERPVPLGGRALEILSVLIAKAPGMVSKATLFAQVWPGTFIEEGTLRYQLSMLRKALGDGENGNRYISTASGKGYCFVAALSFPLPDGTPLSANAELASKPSKTNLPLQLTEIIGRERELADLAEWLQRRRLVTLSGPGGVGKTRLALALGWTVLDSYDAGVWLVDLAPLNDAGAVASAAAAALGVPATSAEAAANAIIAALGKTRLLLIFDNCEHLAEAVAALIKTLLEHAPGVTILTTSQQNLHVAAEHIYALKPLEAPPLDAVSIENYGAVKLFAARARAADRMFELIEANKTDVSEICRKLDGLPLALEMAAGRLRLLGVERLRKGLDSRLRMLKATQHGEGRHCKRLGRSVIRTRRSSRSSPWWPRTSSPT